MIEGHTPDQVTPTLRVASFKDKGEIIRLIHEYWKRSPYTQYSFNKEKLFKHADHMLLDRQNHIFLLSVDENDPDDIKGMLIGVKRQFPFSDDWCSIELFWFVENDDKRRGLELFKGFEGWSKLVGCKFVQYGKMQLDEVYDDNPVKEKYRQMETIYQKRVK